MTPKRPRQDCPVCGTSMLAAALLSHVGGARCVVELSARCMQYADPVRGPRVLALVGELGRLLGPPAAAQEAAP